MILSTILFSYFYKGFFARYVQDDYCYGAFVRMFGFFKTQYVSYMESAPFNGNRYSLTLFMSIGEILGGAAIIKWLPGFWIVLWLAVLVFLFNKTSKLLTGNRSFLKAVLFAEAILVFTFYLAPELYQVLYWRAGSLPYLPPLVFNTYMVARLVGLAQQKIKWTHFLEFGLISFLAAGFSETDGVIQFSFWAIVLILAIFFRSQKLDRTTLIRLIIVPLATTLCGLALLAFSPFNDYALSIRPAAQTNLVKFLTLSFRFGFDILFDAIKSRWLPFAILAMFGFLLGWISKREVSSKKILLQIVIVLAATYLLSVTTATPSVLLGSVYPENRAIFPMNYLLVMSVYLTAFLFAKLVRNLKFLTGKEKACDWAFVLLSIGVMLYCVRMVPLVYQGISPLRARAAAWDLRHEWVLEEKALGKTQIIVPAFDSIARLTELKEDPEYWVNKCAADYYAVDSITAVENYNNVKPYFQ